jgi:Subtilase family
LSGQNNNNVLPGTPSNGHGTHVAGTIAAARNTIGITGVAPDARIMALRLGDVDESNSFVNGGSLAAAIRYAVDNGARVINMSLGWAISAAKQHPKLIGQAMTNAQGEFAIALPPGEYTLFARYGAHLYLNSFMGDGSYSTVEVKPGIASEVDLVNTEGATF